MNNLVMKRKLAGLGIGDPLSTLVYTSGEIEKLKQQGKIKEPVITKSRFSNLHRSTRKKGRFGIAVLMGKKYQLLKIKFNSTDRAKEWGLWNYKGQIHNWKVVEIQENYKEISNE